MDYRIRECCGAFTVQIKCCYYKGVLWWKRKEYSWHGVNIYGGVRQDYQHSDGSYNTLEEAKKRVKEFCKGVVYYECDEKGVCK